MASKNTCAFAPLRETFPFFARASRAIFQCLPLLLLTSSLHAQNLLGKRTSDVILQLGTEYTKVQDGHITKYRFAPILVDHPTLGLLHEYDQYDFINDFCEARHTFIANEYEQDFITDLNKKFGKGDLLWRNTDGTYIAIKEHAKNFELIVWTPTYEKVLDTR